MDKGQYFPIPPHKYDLSTMVYTKGFSRKVYAYLTEDISMLHNKYMKWRQELGQDFCEVLQDFSVLHLNIYKVTNVPKLRSFQYRVLQRALVTNVQLHRWGMTETDLCTFCGEHSEMMVHLFTKCNVVLDLWEKVRDFVYQEYGYSNLVFDSKSIICNAVMKNSSSLPNFVCLVTKQFLYI